MSQSNDWREQFQADLEALRQQSTEFDRRMENYFANQAELNAEFRARQEIQSRQIAELRESIAISMERDNTLRDTLELLITEFSRHRSDGHGA